MTSDERTASAVGLPSRSVEVFSLAKGGPRRTFFSRYRSVSGRSGVSREGRATGATDRSPGRGDAAMTTASPSSRPGIWALVDVGGPGSFTPSGNHITWLGKDTGDG